MKSMRSLLVTSGLIIAACGPHVPASALKDSGISATWREGREVTILYQKSSTTDAHLQEEASSVCAKGGWKAGSGKEVPPSGSRSIPGVDGKIVFQCI